MIAEAITYQIHASTLLFQIPSVINVYGLYHMLLQIFIAYVNLGQLVLDNNLPNKPIIAELNTVEINEDVEKPCVEVEKCHETYELVAWLCYGVF